MNKKAKWIWELNAPIKPKNEFRYFRKEFSLDEIPEDCTLRFAADSNARIYINGNILRRKVTRYDERYPSCELINAYPYLKKGKNVIVALHHNWGDWYSFMRSGNDHAGLWISSSFVNTDETFKCLKAPQFLVHEEQVLALIGDPHARIRFPMIIDTNKELSDKIFEAGFDDSAWSSTYEVKNGPWQFVQDVESQGGQREYEVSYYNVIAAGKITLPEGKLDERPLKISAQIKNSTYSKDEALTERVKQELILNKSFTLNGKAGESYFITFDNPLPLHGYPYVKFEKISTDATLDFGYCEIHRALYDGKLHVLDNGWINTEGVVGFGYADRLKVSEKTKQYCELPDERTSRWSTVHIHFAKDGEIAFNEFGIVKSQYPVERVGTFDCGDEEMNQIVKLCDIHAEIAMSDTFVDTPGREDGQWIEDAQLRARIAASWYGDTGLRKILLRTMAEGQRECGGMHPFWPAIHEVMFPANYDWSMQWTVVLHDEYMYTGDAELVKKYWKNVKLYWDNVLSKVDEKGVWYTMMIYGDLRTPYAVENENQSSGVVSAWVIDRLGLVIDLAKVAGEKDQAKYFTAKRKALMKAFRKYHMLSANENAPKVIANRYDKKDKKVARGISQAGQIVAAVSDIFETKEDAAKAIDYTFPAPHGAAVNGIVGWNNPTNFYRALLAMSETGFSKRAIAHLKYRMEPYMAGHARNPIAQKFQGCYGGPLPEYFVSREDLGLKGNEPNETQPLDETGSHGWGCVPLMWLHDSVLGVRIVKAGGRKLRIAPDVCGLPYISGYVNTPKSKVWVHCDPQQWRLEVELASDVETEIVLPEFMRGKRVSVEGNAKLIAEDTYKAGKAGRYTFICK